MLPYICIKYPYLPLFPLCASMNYLSLFTFVIFPYLTYNFSHPYYLTMDSLPLSVLFPLSAMCLLKYWTDCTHILLIENYKIYSGFVVVPPAVFLLYSKDLRSNIHITSFGCNVTISELLFIISSITKFCVNFNTIVLSISLSTIFTIAKPEISSINRASILTNFCSFGFRIISSLGMVV